MGRWAPTGPTPAWVDAGEGGMLRLGSFRETAPVGAGGVSPDWGARAGWSAPGMQHRGTRRPPRGGCGAAGAPAPHLQPADGKSGLAGGPGASGVDPSGRVARGVS